MTFSGYVQVLRERWKLVLAGLLLGVAVAALLTWTATPRYAASVVFYISAQGATSDAAGAYQGSLMSQQKVKSYVQLLTGNRIRQDIEARSGITVGPGTIAATSRPDTVLLTATVTDPSAQRAKQVADTVGEVFPPLVAELERPAGGGQVNVVARVVEPASLPSTSVTPRPLTNGMLGSLAGLLVGVAAAAVRHLTDSSVRSVEALAEVVAAPVLGAVAFAPFVALRPLIVHDQAGSPRAEAHRQIRTNLQFVDLDRPPKVVVFTSSLPGEGKTTTVCNLAITFAQAGRKVVLVDADLRRPRVADYLGLAEADGLTSVLDGRAGVERALRPWGPQGMVVLAGGPVPSNPSELLASQRMSQVLDELSARCDMVLVNTPPLLPVTDAAVLASRCDGAVLVVRYGKTSRNQVRAASAALSAVSERLLGTVLTMGPEIPTGQSYGYYGFDEPGADRRAGGDHAGTVARGSRRTARTVRDGWRRTAHNVMRRPPTSRG